MIAGCPKCGARYRIEARQLRPEGVRLRCTKCQAVFRVTPPGAAAEAAPAERASAPRETVVLADADVTAGKATAHTLYEWGFEPVLVHDGVEAILSVQRMLPRVVILDAALPKMFGFQVCELMKRNESLRSIHVVLVGAIHDRDRYRRPATETYGADAYLERPQLPEALRPILKSFGLTSGGGFAAGPAAAAVPAPAAAEPIPPRPAEPQPAPPQPAPSAVGPAPAATPEPARDPALADAERLARIIVSDVVLYNPEKFEAGVRDGNVLELLESELAEGRALFEQRVDPRLRESRDLLAEELVRAARAKGMR